MQELIAITDTIIAGKNINSVDARVLWGFIGSKQQFADWVKAKVVVNPFFQKGHDYVLLQNDIKQKKQRTT